MSVTYSKPVSSSWHAYRELCSKERFRPAEPMEKFLQLVLHEKSVASVLCWMDMAGKAEGFEAYVRVLLNWYRNGKLWMDVTDEDEAPIEPMLLESLKLVTNPKLRQEIEETLTKTTEEKLRRPISQLHTAIRWREFKPLPGYHKVFLRLFECVFEK